VTISGFVAGDHITFGLLPYEPTDTVAVTSPGVVTVSAGSYTYNLNIAGATVGSTDYSLAQGNDGLVLNTSMTAASMAFLRPPEPAAITTVKIDLADVLNAAHFVRATPAAPAAVNSATFGGAPDLFTLPHGGTQVATTFHHGTLFG
jgi:hypothetical protein